MNTSIVNKASTMLHKTGFKLKKHSPEILAVTGVFGIVTSAVLACKATTKLSTILDEAKETIDKIHEVAEDPQMEGKYSPEDAKKDLTIVYAQTGVKLVKLYAPAVVLGAASLTAILAGHQILRKRNIALAAAYKTLDNSYKRYRNNVVERFGDVVDKELKNGIKVKKVEETVTDPETGKEKKVKSTVQVTDIDGYSEYARFFDDGCKGWEKDAEMNLAFLRAQQQYANDLLVSRGYLFLNEVYNMLGIPITKAGQVIGWVYDSENPGTFNNYVDFGMYDVSKPKARDFVNGYEKVILLDFNVDGDIWSLMN